MTYEYDILQGEANEADFTFYGGAREFVRHKGPEAIVHGPAETGKTVSALYKLHIVACKYPGASLVIARKTLASTYSTVLQTFMLKVLGRDSNKWPCVPYGGENKPSRFNYHNGSRIWIAGLDKSSKVLSAEHDIVYVNQAEELTLDDWETLTTRTTGRAGNMPYSQTIGDANPAWPLHWIYHRDSLRLFYSKHTENPTLFDQETGEITAQGQRTMAVLNALTGVRRTRFLEGKAAQAEGIIYDTWDDSVHMVYGSQVPRLVRYVAAQDWGYTNPGCLGVWGLTSDDDMYLVAQVYRRGETDDWWMDRAVELDDEFGLEVIACDPSEPAYIAKFRSAGLNARPAFTSVLPGITAVKERLGEPDVKRPRLFIVRDCLRYKDESLAAEKSPCKTEDEIASYVWVDKKGKEKPVKEDDHGLDMMRYGVAYVDRVGRGRREQQPTDAPTFAPRGATPAREVTELGEPDRAKTPYPARRKHIRM